MIQLGSKSLPEQVQDILNDLQTKIDSELTFQKKVRKAQSLWKSKGGVNGKNAFKKIFEDLYEMCVYVGICNYCEQNEANDIEHIYPKSYFPEKTFNWSNYLLACKQCNSGYKLDKCFVINNDDEIIEVHRRQQPPYQFGAFINPRVDNPNTFLILNMKTFKFNILPDLTKRDINKAQKSLDILELNTRDTLIQARKSASLYYYHRFEMLINILKADTIDEIQALLTPYDSEIELNLPLSLLKNKIKESFKLHIITYQHPSVWHSIKKIESTTSSKWSKLFHFLPEALNW